MKYFLAWILSIVFVCWFMSSSLDNCSNETHRKIANTDSDFVYQRLNDNMNEPGLLGGDLAERTDLYPYSRQTPLIFVGGVPR